MYICRRFNKIMYAIVDIAGSQFKVEKDQKFFVNRIEGKEGSKVQFDNVLMLDNSGKLSIGAPHIKGASVEAKIIKHLKDDKVIVFKKKRRKGYRVKNGHRQLLTQIIVEKINEKGSKPLAKIQSKEPKDSTKDNKVTIEPAVKKPVAKKPVARKPAVKKTVAKKPAAKKPVAKKPAAKKPVTKNTVVKKPAAKKTTTK